MHEPVRATRGARPTPCTAADVPGTVHLPGTRPGRPPGTDAPGPTGRPAEGPGPVPACFAPPRPAAPAVVGPVPAAPAWVRRRVRVPAPRRPVHDLGAATAEYAIATLAACGFAGLLVAVLKSPEIRTVLAGVIKKALQTG